MFHKTKKKIIASIIGSLVLLFAVTLASIILSEYYAYKRQNTEMLDRYVEIYSLEQPPGSEPELLPPPEGSIPPGDDSLYQLSSFYSVAFSEDGSVMRIDAGRNGLYSESRLIDTANSILAEGNASGRKNNLLYQVEKKEAFTLVAFIDCTIAIESLLSLTRHSLVTGGIALCLLFLISQVLAKHIVKPLEENDQRQKQFVSDAGHELKTPVSVISTNAELLSRLLGSNEWLDNIRYENERMGDLVTQLLDLSRAESAQLQTEDLDLSRLVTGEVLPFESVAFEHHLTIQSSIADGIRIHGNRSQLSQLVSILLDNAIRHSDHGHEIGLTLLKDGKHIVLSVENNGKEIPADQQAHIFERFYRLDHARNSESSHYGLGLAIAKAICEAHGGTISVSCKDGKVLFTVVLPEKKL
ncbi:MAG: HAMP domain-containing histidine kinase [Solobacterium sp.]|nr:HAMP domain-containing histidine kinase [Solobacterium sp.]